MKKLLWGVVVLLGCGVALLMTWVFLPKSHDDAFILKIGKGQGIVGVANQLAQNNRIYNKNALLLAAYATGVQNRLHAGNYKIPAEISAWQILKLLQQRPQTTKVRIIEGMKFAQMRKIINENNELQHDTRDWSDEKLLKTLDPNAPSSLAEGLFFPDSYEADQGSSDLHIYQAAYQTMKKQLAHSWQNRQADLPYKTPYELLIMASIVEKETGHPDDRNHVAAVFRNRLKIGMRLQTDPTVIYGMGDSYTGKIRRADLERDTPYNTYTRAGLTPTPIALPSKAALEAAAHPSDSKYLYFVSKMDNTGKSQFSHTLDEHNAAVRQYILKK